MPVIKLSLFGQGNEPHETVELDEDLVGQLRATVDAQPDLTLDEAFRRGIQHVVDNGPLGGGQQ
ncbi:MAG: hypothetical protein JWQ45_2100 [Blastococcus sp.]|jgi:hypothetical protein|nr:hypothetical protein [Blastococcus sp.]